MTLVDTSVWIDHFRSGSRALAALLEQGEVLTHPFVVGEVACGHLRKRAEILDLMNALPSAALADHDDVLGFVERHRLYGHGIGWVDAHLLAAAQLSDAGLWTLDARLRRAAGRVGVQG